MAHWSTLMPCNPEAAGSNLSGVLAFFLKGAHYEVDYSGKKTYLAGLQCTLTSSCAKTNRKRPGLENPDTNQVAKVGVRLKLRKSSHISKNFFINLTQVKNIESETLYLSVVS